MRCNRENLLVQLQSVAPGLGKVELQEQSTFFIFKDNQVITYNDEIGCRHECEMDFEGAVPAEPMLAILTRFTEDEVELRVKEGHLLIGGKKKTSGIRMEEEITLDLSSLAMPTKWKKVPPGFLEAIDMAQHTASNDQSKFEQTCIHLTPNYIESTDSLQLTRYQLETGLKENILVKKESIRHVVQLGVIKFAELDNWIHFKNPDGLIFSCHRHANEDYPDLSPFVEVEGDPITLPKALVDAAERASVFSSKNAESTNITIQLSEGELVVKGKGVHGFHLEKRKIEYSGNPMSFDIAPTLLSELVQKYSSCYLSANKLTVDGGHWVYVTSLSTSE